MLALICIGIVVFCFGFAAGLTFMAWLVKRGAEVEGAIEAGCKAI